MRTSPSDVVWIKPSERWICGMIIYAATSISRPNMHTSRYVAVADRVRFDDGFSWFWSRFFQVLTIALSSDSICTGSFSECLCRIRFAQDLSADSLPLYCRPDRGRTKSSLHFFHIDDIHRAPRTRSSFAVEDSLRCVSTVLLETNFRSSCNRTST